MDRAAPHGSEPNLRGPLAPAGAAAPGGGAAAPAAPPERVVARVRRHGRVLILPVLLLIAVAGASVYAVLWLPEAWQRIAVGAGAAVIVLLGTVLPFLAWLTRRSTLTTRRIILRAGVFARTRQELQLVRAHEVSVRRTPGQRLFRSGDVRIGTEHERPLVLRDVPDPAGVQAALDELIDRAHRSARSEPAVTDIDTVIWGTR